jgi:sulfatase modifying factor 1
MRNQTVRPNQWEFDGNNLRRVTERLAVNVKDGSVLVRITAGGFEMGDGEDSNCPKHMVELSEYWMGVYSVTNRQYARFVEETGHREPDYEFWRQPGKAEHPVTKVNWKDAGAYAEWAGLSLPSEAQWENAARGPEGLVYPWGDTWDEGKCLNDGNTHDPYVETTAAVWEYPEGSSGYGTLQQSGNVNEWCADWYDENYYDESPAKDPPGPSSSSCRYGMVGRVVRGGSLHDVYPVGLEDDVLVDCFQGAARGRIEPGYGHVSDGFRLARNSS